MSIYYSSVETYLSVNTAIIWYGEFCYRPLEIALCAGNAHKSLDMWPVIQFSLHLLDKKIGMA